MCPLTPPYRIETGRLLLRCWEPRDAPLLKAAVDGSLEHLRPWMPWAKDEPQTLDQKIDLLRSFRGKFDRDEDYFYGIFDRSGSRVLGGTGFHKRCGPHAFEIGYWLTLDSLGRGFAYEATAALVCCGLGYCQRDRIEIHCDPTNLRSAAIPRKLGFTHEVTRRRTAQGVGEGGLRDTMIWTLLRSEFDVWPYVPNSLSAFDAFDRQVI